MHDPQQSETDLRQRRELPLVGELDLLTAPAAERDGHAALADPALKTLAINLRGVTFIDSTGIGVLIRLRVSADEHGQQLVLVDPSSQVQRVLQVTALDQVFTIEHGGEVSA